MEVGGYFIPRPVLAVVGVAIVALIGLGLWLGLSGSSGPNTATILTPVPQPGVKNHRPTETILPGYVSLVSGVVEQTVCTQGKPGTSANCQAKPLSRARILFLTAHPPDQGKKVYAVTDRFGRYQLKLRSNVYTVSVVGWRSMASSWDFLPTQVRTLPPIIVSARLPSR